MQIQDARKFYIVAKLNTMRTVMSNKSRLSIG